MKNEGAFREIPEGHRVKAAFSGAVIQPLAMKLSVNCIGSAFRTVKLRPELGQSVVIGPAAFGAGAVTRRQRRGLVQEEELGVPPGGHQLGAAPAAELKLAGNPSPGGVSPANLATVVVKAAAVAVDQATVRNGDQIAEGRDAVLKRHTRFEGTDAEQRRGVVLKLISRLTALAAVGGVLTLSGALAAVSSQASPRFPVRYAAPYLQIQRSDAGDMSADMRASGDRFYSLAFLIPKPGQGCVPIWEDGEDSLGSFTSPVTALQNAGGNVIISFGGADGGELAIKCHSVKSLEAAYARVVSTYHVNRLDFDIEGSYLNNTTANARRDQALAQLQRAEPGLAIDYTLPVAPHGMEANALALLRDARSKGVKVSLVNVMTMDFGNGQNVLADAESAAKGSASELARLFGISTVAAYGRMGLTPIAGRNDDNEFFSQADARKLESFAAARGVHELAFWEVDHYDKPLSYAYSTIFQRVAG